MKKGSEYMKRNKYESRVGYVKFISKKSRNNIENEMLRFYSANHFDLMYKDGICVASLTDDTAYEIMIIGLFDGSLIKDIRLCTCKNIREVSKKKYKNKKIKIPYGYHLYEAKIYKPKPALLIEEIPLEED